MPFRLTSQQIIAIWESAQHMHSLDRALYLISCVDEQAKWSDLKLLSIGARNSLLLSIRAATFGKELTASATCPQCKEELDILADVMEIGYGTSIPAFKSLYHLNVGSCTVLFRMINSTDIAAVYHKDCIKHATAFALQQSIQSITNNLTNENLSADEYPNFFDAVADAISSIDTAMLNEADVSCPNCDFQWRVSFDIADYLWREICQSAKSLMIEVQQLARFYGWSESEILNMSKSRRRGYIEVIS